MATAAKPLSSPWAISSVSRLRRFRVARLAYGHGTTNAVDEAAFMMLEALRLPIHNIDPWFDLEPTPAERARLLTLIDARVEPAHARTLSRWAPRTCGACASTSTGAR